MLTRRMFHTRLMAALAATALPVPDAARAADGGQVWLWLNRLTFGATAGDLARFAELGPEAWLEDQLSRPATAPEIDARLSRARLRIAYPAGEDGNGSSWPALDELRPLGTLAADPALRHAEP